MENSGVRAICHAFFRALLGGTLPQATPDLWTPGQGCCPGLNGFSPTPNYLVCHMGLSPRPSDSEFPGGCSVLLTLCPGPWTALETHCSLGSFVQGKWA